MFGEVTALNKMILAFVRPVGGINPSVRRLHDVIVKSSDSTVRLAGFKNCGELVTYILSLSFPTSVSYLFLYDKSPQNVVA